MYVIKYGIVKKTHQSDTIIKERLRIHRELKYCAFILITLLTNRLQHFMWTWPY